MSVKPPWALARRSPLNRFSSYSIAVVLYR